MEQLELFNPPEPFILSINSESKKTLKIMALKGLQVDSIVTDPPYELGFMGKAWDKTGIAYDIEFWDLCLSVLKPGGHLLAFGGSRTYHRMASAIEDAGFEIRDQIMWLYGQGFPKSLNISKALDKMVGAERGVVGQAQKNGGASKGENSSSVGYTCETNIYDITAPTTDAAKQWNGWGSALKPAHEPIVMARKPLSEKNIALNVLKHGTAGINVDGCRVCVNMDDKKFLDPVKYGGISARGIYGSYKREGKCEYANPPTGRFPANIIHDGSDEVMEEFAKYNTAPPPKNIRKEKFYDTQGVSSFSNKPQTIHSYIDSGTAARFFYSAKASKKDRMGSKHPTVKPISLMRYLCRLVTPPNGIVLDPFAGSGTTGQAAKEEGFNAVLIERETEYFNDITKRIYGDCGDEAK